jgi:prophage regulatory protein
MTNKILRLPETMHLTGLSRSSIYAQIADGTFPKQISLGARAVGWIESEVHEWVIERMNLRGN